MNPCREPHARWVASALADGLASLPPEQRATLEACALCSAELAELGATREQVAEWAGRAADEEREDLAALADEIRPGDEGLVRAVFTERVDPATALRAPRAWRAWRALAVLAASIVALAFFQFRTSTTTTAPDPGGGGETLLSSEGAEDAPELVEWAFDAEGLMLRWEDPEDAPAYLVRVETEDGELIHESPGVSERTIRIDAEELTAWPHKLVIEIIPLTRRRAPEYGRRQAVTLERVP